MSRSSKRDIKLPAPYLRRVWLDEERIADKDRYPFCIPLFRDGFEIAFRDPITILIGENGVGKSTVIEGIAALAGFDDAGGGSGYRPVDHSGAREASGGELAAALRASWLPKLNTGWFFKAETFFSVSRYLDAAGSLSADFLSHSHGEGFMRFFDERCSRQGVYFFDEPESALSPARQLQFLKLLRRMEDSNICQVVMATHSPILMAYPGARLLRLSKYSVDEVRLEDTDHFRLMREFCAEPETFIASVLAGNSSWSE